MAATIFAPRNFCLILLFSLRFSSLFYNSETSNGIILRSISFGKSKHYFIYCRDRPSYSSNRPITVWNKHFFVCLLLPPNDLTICVKEILVHSAHLLIISFIMLLTLRLFIVPVPLLDSTVSNSNVSLVFLFPGMSFFPFVIWASSVVRLHF